MPDQREMVLEASTRRGFIDELLAAPGCERLRECIQCGTCSGSCPVSTHMDFSPRRIIAMVRAGLRDQVLASDSIWLCTSCYTCSLRCPRGIAVTDVMYALKRLAIREGRAPGKRAAVLAASFKHVVDARGRNHETSLLMRYYLKADLGGAMKKIGLGIKLLTRGRMPLMGERIEDLDELGAIIAKTEDKGGL